MKQQQLKRKFKFVIIHKKFILNFYNVILASSRRLLDIFASSFNWAGESEL